jgi:hypothetical protein
MQIRRRHLERAVSEGLLSASQAERLWEFLQGELDDTPGFRATHILYYLGGMMAIGAMTLFMTLGWERFGGWGMLGIAFAYMAFGLWLTDRLVARRLAVPAGITAVFVVAITPLAIYGLQVGSGWWAEGFAYRQYHTRIDWRWLFMELGTLAVALGVLWRYRLPFLVMPVALTLWYMSMDLAPFLFGVDDVDWSLRRYVSLCFGLLMILLAFWVDLRSSGTRDYPFWLYLFGVVAFWGGLSLLDADSELGRLFYLVVNLVMIATGALLGRRVFAVFGALGAAGYLGHLAYDVFEDSLLFPFALTLLGFAVIYLGLLWQRHEQRISVRLRAILPEDVRRLLENRE